jgi:hypothetical protein
LEAINEEELIKRIFEYRLRNNIPVGDIERDIDDYYCSRYPDACHREAKDEPGRENVPSEVAEPLLQRVSRWAALQIHAQPKGGYELVSQEQANARGLICVGCPNNRHWRSGCSGCSSSTAAVLAQLRKLQTSRHQGDLTGCQVCGWDNSTAVWMQTSVLPLTQGQIDSLPDRCWRKG